MMRNISLAFLFGTLIGVTLGMAFGVSQGVAVTVGTAVTAAATGFIALATIQQGRIAADLYAIQRRSTETVVRAFIDTYFEETGEDEDRKIDSGVKLRVLNMSAVAILVERLELWIEGGAKPIRRQIELIIPAFTAETREVTDLVFYAARALAAQQGVEVKDEDAWDNWFTGRKLRVYGKLWCLVQGENMCFEIPSIWTENVGGDWY